MAVRGVPVMVRGGSTAFQHSLHENTTVTKCNEPGLPAEWLISRAVRGQLFRMSI
jgi:hypothetical protein